MKINICGVPYKLIYDDVINERDEGITMGQIYISKCEIHLKKGLTKEIEEETLIHEILHGILDHLGKPELSNDENFVQLITHGIFQHFKIRDSIKLKDKKDNIV